MRPIALRTLLLVALVGASALGGSLVARAQQPSPPDVLPALLDEVRGLRAALEQMSTDGPRVQLVLGRVQLQEQRILNQTRRLDSVAASLALARRELDPLTEEVKVITESLNETDIGPGERRRREGELVRAKTEWGRKNVEVQRLAAEETYFSGGLETEQNRWTDFNQKLEDLERALSRR